MRRAGSRAVAPRGSLRQRSRGFTLVEMIVSITLIGILAVVAAPLLRLPLVAWMDASRRADIGATADVVQNKLAADLSRALPNSVRVRQVGGRVWLEFLQVRAHGRHRAGTAPGPQACPSVCSAPGGNDMLEAACAESCFTSLGPLVLDSPVLAGDWLVVNPLGPGVAGGDPYFGGNVAAAGGIKVRLIDSAAAPGGVRLRHAAFNFSALSSTRRFFVVSTPVSYECNPATGVLQRHSGYAVAAVQPVVFAGAQAVPLARNITACSLRYSAAGAAGRGGVVSVWLRLAAAAADTGAAEGIEIFNQFAVSEAP